MVDIGSGQERTLIRREQTAAIYGAKKSESPINRFGTA